MEYNEPGLSLETAEYADDSEMTNLEGVMAMTFRTFSLSSSSFHSDNFFLSHMHSGQNLSLDPVRLPNDRTLAIYSRIEV
jgi:hypothetical protein